MSRRPVQTSSGKRTNMYSDSWARGSRAAAHCRRRSRWSTGDPRNSPHWAWRGSSQVGGTLPLPQPHQPSSAPCLPWDPRMLTQVSGSWPGPPQLCSVSWQAPCAAPGTLLQPFPQHLWSSLSSGRGSWLCPLAGLPMDLLFLAQGATWEWSRLLPALSAGEQGTRHGAQARIRAVLCCSPANQPSWIS